jgi:hypothetical protein
MKFSRSRDLLVVSRMAAISTELLHIETEGLHKMLDTIEATSNVANCCEILNLVRYRVEKRKEKVLKALQQPAHQPFIFIFNKN